MSMLQFRSYLGWVYSGSDLIRVKLSQVGIGSVLKQVRFGSGSGCPFSGHFGSGLNWVGSFQVWVISSPATTQVLFGYGSVYFGCSGPNRFIPSHVSVRVWIQVVRFGFRVSGQFCQA